MTSQKMGKFLGFCMITSHTIITIHSQLSNTFVWKEISLKTNDKNCSFHSSENNFLLHIFTMHYANLVGHLKNITSNLYKKWKRHYITSWKIFYTKNTSKTKHAITTFQICLTSSWKLLYGFFNCNVFLYFNTKRSTYCKLKCFHITTLWLLIISNKNTVLSITLLFPLHTAL